MWGLFQKQNFGNIPVNIQEKLSVQDLVEEQLRTWFYRNTFKKKSSYSGSNSRQSSLNLEAILK